MSMNKRTVIEIFKSITQPLRQAIQAQDGLSEKDLEFDRRVFNTPKAKLPEKKNKCSNEWLLKKYIELKALEKKNMEMLMGIWIVISKPEFQALFNPVEKALLQKVCSFLGFYHKIQQKRLLQKNGEEHIVPTEAIDKIEALYTREYLKLQSQMVLLFPDLFALIQIFKSTRMQAKLEEYFDKLEAVSKREIASSPEFDPKVFILYGVSVEADMLTTAVQNATRRTLALKEIMECMEEGSIEEQRIKRIYENAGDVSMFSDEIMRVTDRVVSEVNKDPFCLRELLCFEEDYKMIALLIDRQDKKKRYALQFLRDLSILVKEGCFENGGFKNKGRIITFSLKHASSSEIRRYIQAGNHTALIEAMISKAEQDLELLGPTLRQFVTSDYFVRRANLQPFAKENDEKYKDRLKLRILHGGESIELFSIENEARKQWKATAPKKSVPKSSVNNKKDRKKFLKVAGLIAPFLILAAIPFVGPIFPIIGFALFGAVGFSYWIEPENEETNKKQHKKSDSLNRNKSTATNDNTNDAKEKVKETQKSSITIGNRRNTENMNIIEPSSKLAGKAPICNPDDHEVEELVIPSHLTSERSIHPPKKVNTCLDGGRWLIEDRNRRERFAVNDEFKMSSPISASESETSQCGRFRDSNDSDSGYRSFPDIEDTSDDEKSIGYIQGSYYSLGR